MKPYNHGKRPILVERRTVLKLLPLLLVLLLPGAPLAPGTALVPTVGGPLLAQSACHRPDAIPACDMLDQCQLDGHILTCPSIARRETYCAMNPGIPPCALRHTPGGGSGVGPGGTRGSTTPTPGVSISTDEKVVKDCADASRPEPPPGLKLPPHVLDYVRQNALFGLTVDYGADLWATIYESDGSVTIASALGTTEWPRTNGPINILIDHERIASIAKKRDQSYWHEFAKTLLHEFYHAQDMLGCSCNNPHEVGDTEDDFDVYDEKTEKRAMELYETLKACLPD